MKFPPANFLLHTQTARELYETAQSLPIIDYHCHLSPEIIAHDHVFKDATELFLGGDHYKWRAMRGCGVPEELITGNAPSREKFRAYASVLPRLIGNPLYHWTALELSRYFGVEEPLTPENADEIYDLVTAKLQTKEYSARQLVLRSHVEALCTTDDPADDLAYHEEIAKSDFPVKVLPAFRPDKLVEIEGGAFLPYVKEQGIKDYAELIAFLSDRIEYFSLHGCVTADHGMQTPPLPDSTVDPSAVFAARLAGEMPSHRECDAFRAAVLAHCAAEYAKRGWVMQLHMSPLRNNSSVMFAKLGPDTGFDCADDQSLSYPLCRLLDSMESGAGLPKTVLYSLNAKDTFTLGVIAGNYQSAPYRSKIQLGSGWWFCDTKDGIEQQLRTLGSVGVLSNFVGMLTDSRSFVSYPRHEYFRRILCNLIGNMVEAGEYPHDMPRLKGMVADICYNNVKEYFGF